MKELKSNIQKGYVEGLIDDVVLVNSLHERANAHHKIGELFTSLFRTLHRLPDIAVQTILRTVVGQNTIDELHVSHRRRQLLAYHTRQSSCIGVTRMKEERKTYEFTVHVKDDHIISVNTIQESLNACELREFHCIKERI